MSANQKQIDNPTDSNSMPFSPLKFQIDEIKELLDEHLTTINQNTEEIQANYSMVSEMVQMFEKLRDQIERIQLYLGLDGCNLRQKKIEPLTAQEQKVFLVLYTAENFVSYKDISRRTGLPETLVSHCITNLVENGILILRRFINNTTYLKLDPVFRDIQAKENIVKLQGQLTEHITVRVR